MKNPTGRVLVVDDKKDVLTAIRLLLKEHVAEVHTARDPSALPTLLQENSYDVILLDMNFSADASSGREGFEWLRKIQEIDASAVVVFITAYGDVEKAVRAMKEGAMDFIVKPWKNEKLVATVQAALELRESRREADRERERQERLGEDLDAPFQEIIGESAPMQRVFTMIEKVAGTDANVLIRGENGTGKELVARALHRCSDRTDDIFVNVDLGALSEGVFESELFGHAQGAFTGADDDRAGRFEVADGGTLFLDEIGNLPPPLQKKLLVALQRREITRVGETEARAVDIRLISATNQPIYEQVENDTFRQDLLYRINTVEIELPPLRERGEDITLLANYFINKYADKYDKSARGMSEPARAKLQRYRWPGNVRELEHTMERAVILSESGVLGPDDFMLSAPIESDDENLPADSLNLEDLEQTAIRKALSKHGGNVSRAADELGLSRKALYRRIEKYGL
ncbi:MAG: sigma-54-dependent Fis family transcriptional regulator [Bacteroidetes bacterium QS_8_64_10]|nr:MAG: sigma-54-dependent Fis family transcriptional regulator [Bacteroidetes bacterium QS_8_64_10]